jgi:hypothetical protein
LTQDERDLFILTEIGQPVPRKHAFGGNHKIIAERIYCPQKCIRPGSYVAVQDDITFPVEDAEIHFVGVQVDSTVKFVLFGVKSHGGLLLFLS